MALARPPSNFRSGFTLIELVAVLLLAAILSATAAVSLVSYRRQVALADAAAQVAWVDALLRDRAREQGRPMAMRLDLAEGTLAGDEGGTLADLAAGVTIARLDVAGEGVGYGDATVPYSRDGRSPSYALLLGDARGRREWLVVAGPTGQVIHADDRTIDDILASPAFRGRPDAD